MSVTITRLLLIVTVLFGTLNAGSQDLLKGQDEGEDVSTDRIDLSEQLRDLREIQSIMEMVAVRLEVADTSTTTQSWQRDAVARLDELIEARQQQQQQQQRSQAANQQPGGEPTATENGTQPDTTGRGAPGTQRDPGIGEPPIDRQSLMRRAWGHLPARVRDRMQSALGEQFLPKYEKLIEEYYKRLAERKKHST